MPRPFQLHSTPPVTQEIKWGKNISKGTSTRPVKLDHLIVVSRERDSNNYIQDELVHEKIGQEPKQVPIILLSDDPQECFSLFRGLFSGPRLGCGARYGEDTALRFFDDNGITDEPYEVGCSVGCSYWQSDNPKKQCKLVGTLYCKLDPRLPNSHALCAVRAKGTHAQRRIKSSLDIVSKQTGGVLANLPLVLRFHIENRKAQDGRTYPIPMLSIEQGKGFEEALKQELTRRAELFALLHGYPHSSREDLLITGVLSAVTSRAAVLNPEEAEDVEEGEEFLTPKEEQDTSPEVDALLEGLPPAKADSLLIKFTSSDGTVNIEALRKHVEKNESKNNLPF